MRWQTRTESVLLQVMDERQRQVERYGQNDDLDDGTGPETRWLAPFSAEPAAAIEKILRNDYEDYEEETGKPTWVHLIREEVAEAFQENDPERLEAELLQVAALCVSWVETLQRRRSAPIDFDLVDLDLPVRVYNSLHRHGIQSVGALCQETPDTILSLWQIGHGGLDEIVAALAEHGLSLAL